MYYRNRFEGLKKFMFRERWLNLTKRFGYIIIIIILFIKSPLNYNQTFNQNFYEQYLDIFNSFLTLSLVIVTIIYVFYSKKILDITREKSQTDLIPKIWIFPENPEIAISSTFHHLTEIKFKIKVYNFGTTPAISSNISFSIPFIESKTKNVTFCQYSMNEFPKVLNPGSINENIMTINAHIPIDSIEKYKDSFLSLNLVFEDVDRNVHNINQYYNLYVGYEKTYFSWSILLDEHYYYLRQKTKHNSINIGDSKTEKILVYRKPNFI